MADDNLIPDIVDDTNKVLLSILVFDFGLDINDAINMIAYDSEYYIWFDSSIYIIHVEFEVTPDDLYPRYN